MNTTINQILWFLNQMKHADSFESGLRLTIKDMGEIPVEYHAEIKKLYFRKFNKELEDFHLQQGGNI